jgi:hypothetical protein
VGATRGRTMVRLVIVTGYAVLMLLLLLGGMSLTHSDDALPAGRPGLARG